MRISTGWLLLGAAAFLAGLIPFIHARNVAAAEIEDTLGILKVIKTTARLNWSNKSENPDLSVGNWHTAWNGDIKLEQFERGMFDPNRVIGINLADVPSKICPTLLARLLDQKQQDSWVRVEVGETVINNQPDLSQRRQLCAANPVVSVYFRF